MTTDNYINQGGPVPKREITHNLDFTILLEGTIGHCAYKWDMSASYELSTTVANEAVFEVLDEEDGSLELTYVKYDPRTSLVTLTDRTTNPHLVVMVTARPQTIGNLLYTGL